MNRVVVDKDFGTLTSVGTTNYKKTLSELAENQAVAYYFMANDCLALAVEYFQEAVEADWGGQHVKEINQFTDLVSNASLMIEQWLGKSVCLVMNVADRPKTAFEE